MAGKAFAILVTVLALAIPSVAGAQARRDASVLRVGAARVDITPSPGELPKNSVGVLDRLYARAIVIESGSSTAALITIDAGGVPAPLWEAVTTQIESELRIPVANVLLTATHTHSAGGPRGPDYAQKIVESVRMASQRRTPARLGYGTGVSLHQRQPPDCRSDDRPLVGRSQLRRALGQDGCGPQVRDGHC